MLGAGVVLAGAVALNGNVAKAAGDVALNETNFPDADITETNAGIGGTGSVFGCYRAIDDLKLKNNAKKQLQKATLF